MGTHVSIAQTVGVREDQFIAIAEQRIDDGEVFIECERVLLRFGKFILEQGKAPGVVFKHTLEHFSVEELSDAMIVIGFTKCYRSISKPLTFQLMHKRMETGSRSKRKKSECFIVT